MDKEMIKLLSYVRRSKHRVKVLLTTDDYILMPSDISKKTGMRPTHVSRALKELKEQKLVNCLNEKEIRGRLFETTNMGKKIIKEIKKVDN